MAFQYLKMPVVKRLITAVCCFGRTCILSLVVPSLLLVQARELGSVRVTRNNSQEGERMGEKTVKVSGKRIAFVIDFHPFGQHNALAINS